jgi:glycerol-3-phosphate dehydrogenase
VEATSLLLDGRRVVGVRAIDRVTDSEIGVHARLTINAAGSSAERLPGTAGAASGIPFLKAMNLVTTRRAGAAALGARSSSARNLFAVPWRGRTLFGTWESSRVCASGDSAVTEAEIAAFVAELNDAFPSLALERTEVALVHRGLVPAAAGQNGTVGLEGHEQIRDYAANSLEGLLTVVGAKYTTARAVAERVTTRVLEKLRRPAVPCRTAQAPLPGGGISSIPETVARAVREHPQLAPETVSHLVAAYGSGYRRVLEDSTGRSERLACVSEQSPVIAAELVYAVRHEMAHTLADAVLRRTPLGALGYPGDEAASRAADLVGDELHWTPEKKRLEIEALRRFYLPSGS